jgi:hypothetical protein
MAAPQIPLQPVDPQIPVANQGGTVHPVYGERRPVMYHLFENEVRSISALNAVALSMFSVASFLANNLFAIMIGWGFAPSPLSDFGFFMLHRGCYFVGFLMLLCFGFGIWAICQKKSIIKQIKSEARNERG